jgi:hypothetical protein
MIKKILLTISLFLIPTIGHCATTWYFCSANANWASTNWTSVIGDQVGCTGATGTPIGGDSEILNSASGNVTVAATVSTMNSLTMTGYNGTLAMGTQIIQFSGGTVSLGGTITGNPASCAMSLQGGETLTSNGVTWPCQTEFQSAGTYVMSNGGSTWTNTGLVSYGPSGVIINQNISGDSLTCAGGLFMQALGGGGTAVFILTGGTWSENAVGDYPQNSLTIAGTISTGTISYGTGTLSYSSGSLPTNSILNIEASCTINSNGYFWPNITPLVTNTITITSPLNVLGTLLVNSNTTFSGNFAINASTFTSFPSANTTITFVSGQTLNVTSALNLVQISGVQINVQSSTSSASSSISYTGTNVNNAYVNGGVNFTDIAALGRSLINYNGGNLIRTSNIFNRTAAQVVIRTPNLTMGV